MLILPYRRGVALMLELLLGFALLSIAVFGLFAIFPTGDKAVVRSVRAGQANELARGLMEAQLSRDYSAMAPEADSGPINGSVTSQGMVRGEAPLSTEFFYSVDITKPKPPNADQHYVDVRVEVYWEEGLANTKHTCVLQSSKGEYF